MKKLFLILLMILVVSALVFSGCAKPAPPPAPTPTPAPAPAPVPKEPIKIGLLYGITGIMAPVVEELVRGAQVAVDILGHEVAGRPVKLVIEDTASEAATALDKARKLAEQDKVVAIFGPLHGGHAMGTTGYLDKVPVPTMAPFGPEALQSQRDWVWMYQGSMTQASYPMGVYAYDVLGYRTASVIATDRAVGHMFIDGFMQAFKPKGGVVKQEQYFPEGTTEFTPYLINLDTDVDFLTSWIGDAAQFSFFPQYKEFGIKLPIVQPEFGGVMLSPGANLEIGEPLVGIITTGHWVNTLDTPGSKEFTKAYKDKFGVLPGPFAGNAMAGMQVLYEAIKKTGGDTSPKALGEALDAVSMDTVIGRIEFTKEHGAIAPMHIIQIGPMPDLELKVLKTIRTRLDFVDDEVRVTVVD